jgi:hypothetical protein
MTQALYAHMNNKTIKIKKKESTDKNKAMKVQEMRGYFFVNSWWGTAI